MEGNKAKNHEVNIEYAKRLAYAIFRNGWEQSLSDTDSSLLETDSELKKTVNYYIQGFERDASLRGAETPSEKQMVETKKGSESKPLASWRVQDKERTVRLWENKETGKRVLEIREWPIAVYFGPSTVGSHQVLVSVIIDAGTRAECLNKCLDYMHQYGYVDPESPT